MHENDDLTEALVRSGLLIRPRRADPPPLPTPSPSTSPVDVNCRVTTPSSPTLSIYDYWHPDYDYGSPYRKPRLVDFGNNRMAENTQPNGTGGVGSAGGPNAAGMAFYEKTRSNVRDLIARRKMLEKKLAVREEMIYDKETEYLENTPSGNVIIGFDNYTKGTTGAAAQRRKTGLTDANRVFSRSSISYNPNAEVPTPAASTPASHAPTPVSSSFANKDKADSAVATPTSTTNSKAGKKGKKATAVSRDDSETDAPPGKKARTNFGVGRK